MATYLSYATPADQPTPASVKIISITGISIASMTLLVRAVLLFRDLSAILLGGRNVFTNAYRIYLFSSKVIFTFFAAWLLVTAIGCLNRKELARVWFVRYAVCYLIALVLDIFMIVLTYCLILSRSYARHSVDNSVRLERLTTITFPSALVAVFACILPIFILIYMRKPAVRAVFR